jgi:hypothetical protein
MGDAVSTISAHFRRFAGDGEFEVPSRAVPYSFVAPITNTLPLVFTTKPRVLSAAIQASPVPVQFGAIGRHGLPGETDVAWIRQMLGPRGLCFLGDMDPVDLMIFCWLREQLPEGRLGYLGISDILIDKLGFSQRESLIIPCTPSEYEAIPCLREVFPDWEEMVGIHCAQILNQGQKIELEATLHSGHALAPIIQSTLA